jgi:hypothetical protein
MAATKLYADQAASAASLWQGVYNPTTNTPDLTDPAVQNHGWSWTVNVAGDTAAALPGIPAGTALRVGDVLQFIGRSSAFAIIAGGPLTEIEADARYLRLAGGTMTGQLFLYADSLDNLEAATKQYVDTHSTNANYVAIAGDTMTGNLVIDTTAAARVLGDASLTLTRNAGFTASIYGTSGPNVRWGLELGDNTVETGANTGSDFALSCYTDAGVFIDTPLRVIRASGEVLFNLDPVQDLGAATKQYVDTEIAANATPPADPVNSIQFNNGGVFGGSASLTWDNAAPALDITDAELNIKAPFPWPALYKDPGNSAYIVSYDRPGGNMRWAMSLGDSGTETGNNAGSDFWLTACDDAGGSLNSPLYIMRATSKVIQALDPIKPLGAATKQYADFVSLPLATSDINFYVATTGNDTTGDGSVAAPSATIQHALIEASRYDYQGLYNVTINIADGTYTENVVIPTFKSVADSTPNWYNGGVNIVGDIVSAGATAPLVIIDGGDSETCVTNADPNASLYITGITFKVTGQWSQGIWSNQDINIGHLGWSVEGTCILHCGGSLQTAANEDMVFVNNNIYIWGFLQAWAPLQYSI